MILTDTFDRADADSLGSPWVDVAGDWGVRSNNGRYIGGLEYPGSPGWPGGLAPSVDVASLVDVGSADMAVEWDLTPGSPHARRLFRASSATNGLAIASQLESPDTLAIYRLDDSPYANSLERSISAPGWQSERVRVECVGSTVSVYVAGDLVGSPTITAKATLTKAGIGGNAIGWDPTGAFSDSFTRSDASTLGSPWTAHAGTWGIDSNRAKYVSGTGTGAATVDLGSPIQTVEWTWSALAKGPSFHIFRFSGPTNFWFVAGTGSSATTLYLFQRSGVTDHLWATATGVTWGPGSTLRVEAGASDIKVYSGGTLVITHTVSPGYGSRAGIGGNMDDANLATTRWSSFSGEGVDTDAAIGGSTGPWLNDLDWTRFYCSPWPIPNRGWSVGFLKF